MWASQTTKSTVLENVCGYFIAADASPILLVQPTVEMAQAWSKERFVPTIRDTPVLRELITDAKSRDASNTIQLKTFPGGNLAIIGANAPTGLAARSRRVVLLDEVDRFPASAGTEGDPVALAIKRTESFWNGVVYLTSTPTIKHSSRIESEFKETDQRKWFVPCHACLQFQPLEWAGVVWPEGQPEEARYKCHHCETLWTDQDRVAAIRKGEWRPTAPFKGKRGYFLNGIYSPFKAKRGFKSRLHQMVTEFLEAKHGGPEQLKTWTNTFLAETWQDEGDSVKVGGLIDRRENYSPEKLPNEVVLVVAGADVQKDRIELEWIGYGKEYESWGIRVDKIVGDTEKPETWLRLSQAIEVEFTRQDGAKLRPAALAIDAHFRPQAVRGWVNTHGTRCLVFPVLGIGQAQGSLVEPRRSKQYGVSWSVSTDAAKDILFSRFKIDVPGPRYCHFPIGYDEKWFIQLGSERAVTKHSRGYAKRVWEKTPGARNEAIDMRVYALACLEILRPNIDAIAKTIKPPAENQETSAPVRQVMRRGGWVNGWK